MYPVLPLLFVYWLELQLIAVNFLLSTPKASRSHRNCNSQCVKCCCGQAIYYPEPTSRESERASKSRTSNLKLCVSVSFYPSHRPNHDQLFKMSSSKCLRVSSIVFAICLVILVTSVSPVPRPRRRESTITNDWYETGSSSPTGGGIDSEFTITQSQIMKWAHVALRFFDYHRCTQVNIGSEEECSKLASVQKSQIAVYAGYDREASSSASALQRQFNSNDVVSAIISDEDGYKKKREELLTLTLLKKSVMGHSQTHSHAHPQTGSSMEDGRRKVYATLPDSTNTKASGEHDAVLVLDPYPYANFGHLVALFYVDFGLESKSCKGSHQVFVSGGSGTCISVAKKPRCPNKLEKHASGYSPRRCHVDFIPTVHSSTSISTSVVGGGSSPSSPSDNANTDLMECVNLPGFAACPELRPVQDTQTILCDATHTNTKRCETSHSGVGGRCKLFQTCDRGILIGGGWNRLHSGAQSYENIVTMESMLLRVGVSQENIKTFYANGGTPGVEYPSAGAKPKYFSSAMKTGLRGHIRTVCETKHCADSLFIYLNNPTTTDGDFLLWDVDANGIAGEMEIYTTNEFFSDISNCEANRVVIVADQSNTDILMSLLKDSTEHQNVILTTAGFHSQVTRNGELTRIWSNRTHSMSCLQHVYQHAILRMKDSIPEFYDSSQINSFKISLIGAPCDLNPSLTTGELRSLYQGCQNIPTSVWFSLRFGGDASDPEEEYDSSQSKDGEVNVSGNRRTR